MPPNIRSVTDLGPDTILFPSEYAFLKKSENILGEFKRTQNELQDSARRTDKKQLEYSSAIDSWMKVRQERHTIINKVHRRAKKNKAKTTIKKAMNITKKDNAKTSMKKTKKSRERNEASWPKRTKEAVNVMK